MIGQASQLDVLVNNAGMMQEASVEEMSLQNWHHNLSVNLTAPFLMIQAALPHLRKTSGSIVNTGSIEGLGSNPGYSAYCASKTGLHGLTRAVAVDHGYESIGCDSHMGSVFIWHILSPIETFAKVEAMSESRSIEDLPIVICCSFEWIPVFS